MPTKLTWMEQQFILLLLLFLIFISKVQNTELKCAGSLEIDSCLAQYCFDSIDVNSGKIDRGCDSSLDFCDTTGCKIKQDLFVCCCEHSYCNGKSSGYLKARYHGWQVMNQKEKVLEEEEERDLMADDGFVSQKTTAPIVTSPVTPHSITTTSEVKENRPATLFPPSKLENKLPTQHSNSLFPSNNGSPIVVKSISNPWEIPTLSPVISTAGHENTLNRHDSVLPSTGEEDKFSTKATTTSTMSQPVLMSIDQLKTKMAPKTTTHGPKPIHTTKSDNRTQTRLVKEGNNLEDSRSKDAGRRFPWWIVISALLVALFIIFCIVSLIFVIRERNRPAPPPPLIKFEEQRLEMTEPRYNDPLLKL